MIACAPKRTPPRAQMFQEIRIAVPLFVANILGEELCWRGYLQRRQEAALGRKAWLANGIP